MKTVLNPVKIVSDFLKSAEGIKMMDSLEPNDRHVSLGMVDGITVVLGKEGFKIKRGKHDEPATAYDVFDVFLAGHPMVLEANEVPTAFLHFVERRCAAS